MGVDATLSNSREAFVWFIFAGLNSYLIIAKGQALQLSAAFQALYLTVLVEQM